MGSGDGFGQAVPFDVTQTGKLEQLIGHRFGHGRPAAADVLEAGQVEAFHVRVGKQIDGHGDDVGPAGDPVALDQLGRGAAVPAGHQHDAGAHENGAVHGALHAGDVEIRQRRQGHALAAAAGAPGGAVHAGGHHRAMGVHAALGRAGGAGAVGEHGQIVRAHQQFTGLVTGAQGVAPGDGAGGVQRLRRGGHLGGQVEVGLRVNVVAVGGDDHMAQTLMADQRLDVREHFLAADAHGGLGVLQVVLELGAAVHRVDRHDNGVGAQNGVVTDDELRCVLHEQHHPVAFFHAQVLQFAGQGVHLLLEFPVGDGRIVVDDRVLIRVAQSGNFEVAVKAGFRKLELVRQPLRPDGKMPIKHACALP